MTLHTLDAHDQSPHFDQDLRHVRAFELAARDVRIAAVELKAQETHATQTDVLEMMHQYAVEQAKLSTTIRNASAAAIVLIPLLASFGAWLVLRQFVAAPPAAAHTQAARTAVAQDTP